jgi:hypothetical protein
MFTKNVFTQTDVVADLIKGINEADYKAKMEALKGGQKKIDKNHNNKIDADDFKILRGEKKVNEEQVEEADTSVKIPTATGTRVLGHRYGNAAKTHRDSMSDPFAVVKGPGQKDIEALEKKKTKKEEIDPNVTTTDTLPGRVKGSSSNPFLKAKVKLNVNEEELSEAMNDNLHPTGAALLKHIKPEHHNLYKPHLTQDIFNGSFADRHAVLTAAKQAGHLKEEAEQVDERTLTKGETEKKEKIVHSMKKSLSGFKARYGDKAKSVMYATATKQAKKD